MRLTIIFRKLTHVSQSLPTKNSWWNKKSHIFLIRWPNLGEGPVHVHIFHVYMISPDVGQCLEKSCIQHAIHTCLDMHEGCTYVRQRCFQVALSEWYEVITGLIRPLFSSPPLSTDAHWVQMQKILRIMIYQYYKYIIIILLFSNINNNSK